VSNFRLRKSERICNQILISEIFTHGKTIKDFPLFVHYLKTESGGEPLQVLFSVPKKKFKSAVKRNQLKRRMREAYRLNKLPLYETIKISEINLKLVFVYAGNDFFSFHEMEKKIIAILERLSEMHEKGLC